MLEFHRVTRCPTWAAEASPCAGTSMPCNPIVPEVPFGGGLLSVISPLLPLGEVDDGVVPKHDVVAGVLDPLARKTTKGQAKGVPKHEGVVHLMVLDPLARKTTKGVPKHEGVVHVIHCT